MEIALKGKETASNCHLTVPYRPIVADPSRSVGEGGLEGNLIIQGDNLRAFKALHETSLPTLRIDIDFSGKNRVNRRGSASRATFSH